MSDSDAERQRKLKAGRAKLMEFKQMKKKKKKAEAAAASASASKSNSKSESHPVVLDASKSGSQRSLSKTGSGASRAEDNGDQDTENDAVSLSSAADSHPASPLSHEGGDNSYTSGSEYTSADESYTYSEDGVDSLVVANLERNELKNRVIELEENLRGKQSVMKDLNKENYELRAKLNNYESQARQEASPSPVLRRELESLQDTLRNNQKRLEEMNRENHEMRSKLAQTGHEEKSASPKIEEMEVSRQSKVQIIEALNIQNQELSRENQTLKSRLRERSPDNSQSDSQVESLQENLKTKQTVISELNKQNQGLREKLHELSQSGSSDAQLQSYKRKISDMQLEIGLKDDELERLRAIEMSFMQAKDVMKELTVQSQKAKEELAIMNEKFAEVTKESQQKEEQLLKRCQIGEQQLEKVQSDYHEIVTVNNDHLMKIQILEGQINNINEMLGEKDKKIGEMDVQVSLAVGERDAVQLEARTQVEDFEERIKAMQEQLQKNGATILEYEESIQNATAELTVTKNLVIESEKMLEQKNQDISLLQKKLETVEKNGSEFSNERDIYQEEIDQLRRHIEEKQKQIKEMGVKMNDMQGESKKLISEKEKRIDDLEKEKSELEKLRIEDMDNLQSHFDRLFEEQQLETEKKLATEKEKWETEMNEKLKKVEDEFDAKVVEMKTKLESEKENEIRSIHQRVEIDQSSKIEEMKVQLTEAIVAQGAEDTRAIIEENEDKVRELDAIIAARDDEIESLNEKLRLENEENRSLLEQVESLHSESSEKIPKLESLLASKSEEVNSFAEQVELQSVESERLKEDLTSRLDDVEKKNRVLEANLAEKTSQVESAMNEVEHLKEQVSEWQKMGDMLKEDFGKEMATVKYEYEERLKNSENEVMNLKDISEKDKADFMQFVKECEGLRGELQRQIEDGIALREANQSLDLERSRIEARLVGMEDSNVKLENLIKEAKNENSSLKEKLEKLDTEKREVSTEYEAEIRMLKDRMNVISKEHSNELVENFNQTVEKLKQEKDEQIRSLKDEISHLKDGNEKYLHDLQADIRQLEDENQTLRLQIKDLNVAHEKEKSVIENTSKAELEKLREAHGIELVELKEKITRELEGEHLKLKENYWRQLKRHESERESEIRRVVEDCERDKSEALEILRGQLEEDKHREVHDIVCNMTKEQKENAAQLKSELENQLAKVQEERDLELRNIQIEYQSYKENKKAEMEDLVSSQITKYQEEQETLQKRLRKSEDRLRKLGNEKAELERQIEGRYQEEIELLKEKLAAAENRLEALVYEEDEFLRQLKLKDNVIEEERGIINKLENDLRVLRRSGAPMTSLFEQVRSEIHNLSMEEGETSRNEKVVSTGDEGEDTKIGASEKETELESSLDQELKEITRLCKGEIIDLAYKLKNMKSKVERSEKEKQELSTLNQNLNEEVRKLEAGLNSSKEELNRSYEVVDNLKEMTNMLNNELAQVNEETGDSSKGSEVVGGKSGSSQDGDLAGMNSKMVQLSAEIESKLKEKEDLDVSLSELKAQIQKFEGFREGNKPVVEEHVSELNMQHEEAMIVPEVMSELEMIPLHEVDEPAAGDEVDATPEHRQGDDAEKNLEIKHLQQLLVDNNEKVEQQKQEIKELREALENERTLFAEQLKARAAKEMEWKSSTESLSNEVSMREKRELMNMIASLEQRLIEKDRSESELRDENWRLVNLLKDSNEEMFTEKESLQEQLVKQEEIVMDLQKKVSTDSLVTNEIQEAFGRQLAALHRQRDALIEQLEQHKREHQGYAKVVQEKAALEDRLREEKRVLSEKLRQKEALEMELAAERAALNEKIVELEKLREMLNGKDKLATELADQRDELKMELTAIEERLRVNQENLNIEREELERELEMKDYELRKWEEDFKSRESEFLESQETLRDNFGHMLESTRADLEKRNDENLRQLRTDLDEDYRQRITTVETGLHDQYGQQISRLREEHDTQLGHWLDLSDWLLDSLLSLPCFKMNRAKAGFEEKLLDLRRQLDEERLRQVRTVKDVLEREHSRELMDLEAGHDLDMGDTKKELEENHRLEMERLRKEFEDSQRNVLEDLQATLITEAAIRVGISRLAAEQEMEGRLRDLQLEMEQRLEETSEKMESEKEKAIKEVKEKCDREMMEKVDEVMREMQAEKEAELENVMNDASNNLQERIKSLEEQLTRSHDPQRRQANIELDSRHETEVEKVKSELVQKCGDDDEMFHTLGEFEAVQENYFQERLRYVHEEHEIQMENIVKEYEILLLRTKNELDVLREDDFQRIRRLQDEIYAKEEAILEMRKNFEEEQEKHEKELTLERNKYDKEMAKKIDEQIAIVEKEKEVWNNDKENEIAYLKTQFEGRMIEYGAENEEKFQALRARYEEEMLNRDMQYIKREEDIRTELGARQTEERIQMMGNQYAEQLRQQDEKHRQELEQAVFQLSTNLKEDFNHVMADMKANFEAEKAQMRKDFKKEKRNALDDLREELAAESNIQLKEMKMEYEHDKVAEIAQITTQLSLKNAVDLEKMRENISSKYEKEMDAIKREMQEDFARNALRQAEQIEDLEMKHEEEIKQLRRKYEQEEVDGIRQEVQSDIMKQAEQLDELEARHAEDLRKLREKYERDEVEEMRQEVQDEIARDAWRQVAEVEELERKHAEELKRLRQKYGREDVEHMRQELEERTARRSVVKPEEFEELEIKHANELNRVKSNYEAALREKTQELQNEVNVLKSLLEGSDKAVRKMSMDLLDSKPPAPRRTSRDSVDAIPTAPPLHQLPGIGFEHLIVPVNRFGEGGTPFSSTETLIPRFAEGEVESAFRDALQDVSSDDGSRVGTSMSGSISSLFHGAGARDAPWTNMPGRDEVEQNRESALRNLRQRYRRSDSDSGKSCDQMMEAPLTEEEERLNKILREKDEDTRGLLAKQREEYDILYQGRIQELEKECAQMEDFIHKLNYKHEQDINALKEQSLKLAEEKIKEVREEAVNEKIQLLKDDTEHLETSKMDLIEKHEKMLKKFMKQQEEEMEELKREHIDELGMLQHELTMKHERQMKEASEKQGEYLLQTRERYEKLLREEREKAEKKHAEDARKLKQIMERNLDERQRDLVKDVQDQYESDLRRMRISLEEDNRKVIDQLTKDHMVEMDRAKETLRRELTQKFEADLEDAREKARKEYDDHLRAQLTERVMIEIDRAHEEARNEHISSLRQLENQLEETHIQQLQTLQKMREKHKTTIDDLKREHKAEMEDLEKDYEEKLKSHGNESRICPNCGFDLNAPGDVVQMKNEVDEAHKKELEDLKNELTQAKSKIVAIEAMKGGMEKTYTETIKTLQEDYEHEITKLKDAIEKIKDKQLEHLDRNVDEAYNTEQRIIKQNFEQQISEMKRHYEMLMNEMGRSFEQQKRHWLEQHVEKYEKKIEDINALYEQERKVLTDEICGIEDEHAKQMDALMDKVKTLTAELDRVRKQAKELREENIVLGNKTQVTDDQYNTLVARHERKEEENTKYIKMLSSDVEKCESEKTTLKNSNEKLLQTLSDGMRASMLIEDLINRHLDNMIQETSRTESGVDLSEFRSSTRSPKKGANKSFKLFGRSPGKSKKDKTLSESNLADVTQYSNLSGGSLFSDEGLDLSFLSKEKLFSGPELDANSEEMVRGIGERLHSAVEHLLKMLSMSTKQTLEARQSYDQMITKSSEAELEMRRMREDISEELQIALEKLEKEHELRENWEKDARKKQSENQALIKERDELKLKLEKMEKESEKLEKENKESEKETSKIDKEKRDLEDRCHELEAEREILSQVKRSLEIKVAELRTHQDKDNHDLKIENEDLRLRLSRAIQLSGDEFDHVIAEIDELKDRVHTLSDEKEALRTQLKEAIESAANTTTENDRLRENISEVLQSNIELIKQSEGQKAKIMSLESAFEETLEERRIAQDEAIVEQGFDVTDFGVRENQDSRDAGVCSPGGASSQVRTGARSPNREVSKLKKEIDGLKEIVESLKEENDNLVTNLENKVENELELLNKISDLENDLYRSANEGFESEIEDKQMFMQRRRSLEQNFKCVTADNDKMKKELTEKENELTAKENEFAAVRNELTEKENELAGKELELATMQNELAELQKKVKELLNDKHSIFDELATTKSLLSEKDLEFSLIARDAETVRKALAEKDEELSVASSEVSELKETIEEQQTTIENQHNKILDLLQKQGSDELKDQYVQELEEHIKQEKVMLLEKDKEIQMLIDRLGGIRDDGDGEDSQSKVKRLEELEAKIKEQENEIQKLKKAAEDGEEKLQNIEKMNEINLQKTIHHVRSEAEQANKQRIAKLKEEHQAEIDRMLEMSRVEMSDLGQRFEEQVLAAEQVNLQLLENFFKNRTMNESQAPTIADENAPVESILNDLQSEAEKIAQLVNAYHIAGTDPNTIQELQNSWTKEKKILLEAVKALRELVSRASNAACADAENTGEDWRLGLLKAVEEVFAQEYGLLAAELETLENIPTVEDTSADLISQKKKRLQDQSSFHKEILKSLNNKDRESLLDELVQLRNAVDELENQASQYKELLDEVKTKAELRESNLTRQFESQASLVDQERAASSQLRTQLEEAQNRNTEVEQLVENERRVIAELRKTLESDEEKIRDLVNSLENERKELKEIRKSTAKEHSKNENLEQQLQTEKQRSLELQKALETEREQLAELTSREKSNVDEFENLLAVETNRNQELTEVIRDITDEKSRLLQAVEIEQKHAKKIEDLCEEQKLKASQEKNERQRLEKIAERYQKNLEEMSKLFEAEKKRRMENEAALKEQKSQQEEAFEKGQKDSMEKEKLKEKLDNATGNLKSLKNELERAKAKIISYEAEMTTQQSEAAMKIAELKKQNAEQMNEIVEKSKRMSADEIERERATSRQLREALNSLQLKYETARSQFERMRESMDQIDGSQAEREVTPKTSPKSQYSVSSRVMDPLLNRCNNLVTHCQDVIANEQQRMTYGAERPSERHIKELQSTYDALAALLQELNELQRDVRALERDDQSSNSPLARLEQAHNKNEELRDHIRKLVKEKSEFRSTLAVLEEQVMEYRKREAELEEAQDASKEAKLRLKSEELKWEAERNALEQALNMASIENANLKNSQSKPEPESLPEDNANNNKVSDAGWTLQKIQKLYGRCLRAESFRKALIYQKKYLLFLLGGFQETEAITLSMIAKMNDGTNPDGTIRPREYGKSRAFMRFRTAARVIIATSRMKFLVKKWSRSVAKITVKSRKSGDSNASPSAPLESSPEKNVSSQRYSHSKRNRDRGSDHASEDSREGRAGSKGAEVITKSTTNGHDHRKQRQDNELQRMARDTEHVTSRSRRGRRDRTKDEEHSNYTNVRDLDRSPPRAYPRPASPRVGRNSPPIIDSDAHYLNGHSSQPSSRTRSPMSRSPGLRRSFESPSKHQRSMSASGLEETNTSLNAYIKKLEMLQAKLKAQGTDSSAQDTRRF